VDRKPLTGCRTRFAGEERIDGSDAQFIHRHRGDVELLKEVPFNVAGTPAASRPCGRVDEMPVGTH
jgi:Asp-tRNA(Asn)/Glu-tRNA(Gln) amidotransferase A subunit family amidase